MENKVLITDSEDGVNFFLDKGWTIKTVVAQHVASPSYVLKGMFCFVLERHL
jgi:hypothetical protein